MDWGGSASGAIANELAIARENTQPTGELQVSLAAWLVTIES